MKKDRHLAKETIFGSGGKFIMMLLSISMMLADQSLVRAQSKLLQTKTNVAIFKENKNGWKYKGLNLLWTIIELWDNMACDCRRMEYK